ncbi:MAG TPA: hypothetical protein VJ599_00255 [Nitrososphaeraceae archaeon]|nr:hypothetical protein [Nitrososphaeraceae archaeon]
MSQTKYDMIFYVQYKSSDAIVKITDEEVKVRSQKTRVTTNQQNPDE